MMDFDELGLYFPAKMAGLDGECFHYSVYYQIKLTDAVFAETRKAITDYFAPFYENDDTYPGDIDIINEEDMVQIELDLGNVAPRQENKSVEGILMALNEVPGIERVVVNEGCDCECNF